MPYLSRQRPPTTEQQELAELLHVDLKPTDSIGIAAARLMDAIVDQIQPPNGWRRPPRHVTPSPEQCRLADEVGACIDGETARVAQEIIADRIEIKKLDEIKQLDIRPGKRFCRMDLSGDHHIVEIHSVGPDGVVRLKRNRGHPTRPEELHRIHYP